MKKYKSVASYVPSPLDGEVNSGEYKVEPSDVLSVREIYDRYVVNRISTLALENGLDAGTIIDDDADITQPNPYVDQFDILDEINRLNNKQYEFRESQQSRTNSTPTIENGSECIGGDSANESIQ